jgi:hypothetical protein
MADDEIGGAGARRDAGEPVIGIGDVEDQIAEEEDLDRVAHPMMPSAARASISSGERPSSARIARPSAPRVGIVGSV